MKNKLYFPGVIYSYASSTMWATCKSAQGISPVILPVSLIMEITDEQKKMNSGNSAVVSTQLKH